MKPSSTDKANSLLDLINNSLDLRGKTQPLEDAEERVRRPILEYFPKKGAGKLPAPPYESVYASQGRSVMQEKTIEVRKKYLEAGLLPTMLYKIPDDHVATEFEFMYYLYAKKRTNPWKRAMILK